MKELNAHIFTGNILDLQNTFKKQGYLYLKHFFSKDEINDVLSPIERILEEQKIGYKQGNYVVPTTSINKIGSPEFITCLTALMKELSLHAIGLKGKLPAFVKMLLNDEVFSHPRKMVRITYPFNLNPNDRIPPHQDLYYVKGEKDTFTCWIPLGDYPPNCGGLLVAHGSHQKGLLPVSSNADGNFNCTATNVESLDLDWRESHYEIGDLLIMHSLTLHQSGKNLADHFRLSMDCRFSSLYGAINADQLLPPYYPKVPNWNELAEQWTINPFASYPASLSVEPNDKSVEDILQRHSKYIA